MEGREGLWTVSSRRHGSNPGVRGDVDTPLLGGMCIRTILLLVCRRSLVQLQGLDEEVFRQCECDSVDHFCGGVL